MYIQGETKIKAATSKVCSTRKYMKKSYLAFDMCGLPIYRVIAASRWKFFISNVFTYSSISKIFLRILFLNDVTSNYAKISFIRLLGCMYIRKRKIDVF